MLPAEVRAQRLSDLIRRPISSRLIQYVSQQASSVIPCHTLPPTSKNNHHEETSLMNSLPTLPVFIQSLIKRSCVKPGTILGALVFLDRLKRRLAHLAKGMPCTCHRIFLATLIVTSKSLHDTSPKNKHWARYAVHFNLSEINLMEQQLLSLMNYQLIITPEEIDHVFVQYEIYKSQHQRHHVLPTPMLSTSVPLLTKDHPLLQHSPAVPPPTASFSTACLNNPAVPLPMPMEPRYIDSKVNVRLGKQLDSITDESTGSSYVYPHSRLFPMSSLSSSSLSSSSSTSLCTPSSSSTSLNMTSTLQTPLTSLNLASSESLCLPPEATNLQPDQDPVLFYPPAHVRDNYRSHSWNSLWHTQPSPTTKTTDINLDGVTTMDHGLGQRKIWSSNNGD